MELTNLKNNVIGVIYALVNHLLTTTVMLCLMVLHINSVYMSAIKYIAMQVALMMSSFAPTLQAPVKELDGNKIWGIYEIFKLLTKTCESLYKQDVLSYCMLIACLCYFYQFQAAIFLVQHAAISMEIAKVAIEMVYLATNLLAFILSLGNIGNYKQSDSMLYLVSIIIAGSAQVQIINFFGLAESVGWLQKNYLKELLGSMAASALSHSVFGRQEEYYKPTAAQSAEMDSESSEEETHFFGNVFRK